MGAGPRACTGASAAMRTPWLSRALGGLPGGLMWRKFAFQVRDDRIVAERRSLGLQDGLDLAQYREDIKLSPERPREFDRLEQRLTP